ncbi:ArsA family ATPase [Baekduia soli]|uniref:ArsA family ATPase n=1 Tax=Baekduia soli TaxID=496014 RepID=UPI0016520EF8|nr:ArsA-related P-loop ATPase [Baekduia soli]
MSAADLLEGRRVCICAGSGGVGKTTTAAALAAGLAAGGARVALVTIDPARRLAQALGLRGLGNDPERLDPAPFAAHGLALRGELWAMTLDPKRTFDDLVGLLVRDAAARDAVLANRIYRELSGAVAGSQEWTAVAKLDELAGGGRFDVVVLDTPPSRNALDLLDAPDRLTALMRDRAVRALAAPGGVATGWGAHGAGAALRLMRRVTGVDLLGDLGDLVSALGTGVEGFAERAERVGRLLCDPATAFMLVTAPTPGPVGEALFLRTRLRERGMPFAGAIVNRFHPLAPVAPSTRPRDVAAALPGAGPGLVARTVLTLHEAHALAARDAAQVARLRRGLGGPAPLLVPELDDGVHDLAGVAAVAEHLFAGEARGAELLAGSAA